MAIVADLHIHSSYSRATSPDIRPETLHKCAQVKGIHIVGTGDCTHPQWLDDLEEKLEPAEEGLWRLKSALAREVDRLVPPSCRGPVRFIFQTELSTIYKKAGRTRKVHHLVLLPDPHSVRRLNIRLSRIGNLGADGRPILGLDSSYLLEMVLEACDEAIFVPAHIWTPWFSVFGSKSGFDAIEECYGDLSPHITALETGLSSDPAMNWQWSRLDRFQLVSNSDAHSPSRLGREANLLEIPLSYTSMREALTTGKGFLGTIEFFPEEGKYHLDGHRKCNVRLEPDATRKYEGICPACDRPLTIGVMNRVEQLKDREAGFKPVDARPFWRLLPLEEVLGEILACGPRTLRVQNSLQQLLDRLGPEIRILRELPSTTLDEARVPLLSEAIRRMREGRVLIKAGFDGQYGEISLFHEGERTQLQGQINLLKTSSGTCPTRNGPEPLLGEDDLSRPPSVRAAIQGPDDPHSGKSYNLATANPMQREAVLHGEPPLMIIAGPGTGKTLTLTYRIAHFLLEDRSKPDEILGVTFTHRAAEEMKRRLFDMLNDRPWVKKLKIQTLHAFGYQLLRRYWQAAGWDMMPFVADAGVQMRILIEALREECEGISTQSLPSLMDKISLYKQMNPGQEPSDSLVAQAFNAYQKKLKQYGALDYDDLLLIPLWLLDEKRELRGEIHDEIRSIFVDEYQDLNPLQVRLLKRLYQPGSHLTVIGDPDQSIYGFRGATKVNFIDFQREFPNAKILQLEENYRSTRIIVEAALEVISNNNLLFPRALVSKRDEGVPISCQTFDTEKGEAIFVAQEINRLMGGTSHWAMHRTSMRSSTEDQDLSFGDIAVLYRLHALSDQVEEALTKDGIPFQRYGDRALRKNEVLEVLLASLRFVLDPRRDDDLLRILSIETIGLSRDTIENLRILGKDAPQGLWESLLKESTSDSFDPKDAVRLRRQIQSLSRILDEPRPSTLGQVVRHLVSSLRIHIPEPSSSWNPTAVILREFMTAAEAWEYDLASFQDLWCLQEELDLYDPRSDRVTLLTAHAAKGLEFSVVFLIGCEEGVFPHLPQAKELRDLEEERRLFFVALTRAKDLLYLTRARSRRIWGQRHDAEASRFLSEIPSELLKAEDRCEYKPRHKMAHQLKLF